MPIDTSLTGLPQDTQIDGTELIETLARDGRRAVPLADVFAAMGGGGSGVEGATPANLLAWATARGKLRAGVDSARVAFIGDSKTMGAGAGTGARATTGAFARSRPARFAALLTAGGLNARLGFAGYAGTLSPGDRTLYDPRVTFGSGWTGGAASLGGGLMVAAAGSGSLTFQPGAAVDRFSLMYRGGADRPAFTIAKGSETINVVPSGATMSFARYEAVFTTKDASPIVITQTGASNSITVVGGFAWDSAAPAVEVLNCGVFGVVSSWWTDASTGIAPLSALASYAPHLTIINLGTNDVATSVPMATWLANLRTIITTAKATGSAVLTWPAVAGAANTYGTDDTRATWAAAARALAAELGCLFVNEEVQLGGRAAAQAAGAMADGVHEAAWAYDVEAAVLARALG